MLRVNSKDWLVVRRTGRVALVIRVINYKAVGIVTTLTN